MTMAKTIHNGAVVIWPENEDEENFAMEHSIVVATYSDSIGIEQKGNSITVPKYALKALIKALRDADKL